MESVPNFEYSKVSTLVLELNWNNIQNIFKKVYWNQKSYKFNDFEKHFDICCTKMQTSTINLTQKFRKKVRNAYVVYKIPKNRKQEFHNIWITNNIIKLESNIISNNKSFISKKSQTFLKWLEIQIFKQIQIWNKSSDQFEAIIFIFKCYYMIKYNDDLKVWTSLFNHRIARKSKW